MRCRHGVVGPCAQCSGERLKNDLLLALADALVDVASELNMDAKVDGVRALAKKLRGGK